MADITANVDAWSTTEGNNPPSGATTIGTGLNDNFQAQQAAIALWLAKLSRTDNLALSASVGSNALTIALKGKDGNDPSLTNKVRVPFRSVTAATGDYEQVVVSAASSLVISSGSTLGAVSATPFRLWIVAFNDGGTFRLGAINCVTTSANAGSGRNVDSIFRLSAWAIASSTAEGAAGAADSAQTFYTGSAVTSKAYVVLGYMTWESGLTTAGTWDAAPTRVQLFGPGVALPGSVIQVQCSTTGAVATGTTTIPNDDTIPQITEGIQFMTNSITPSSAANPLAVRASGQLATNAAGSNVMVMALFQDAVANALATRSQNSVTDNGFQIYLENLRLAGTTSAITFRIRAGLDAASTTTFNGIAATARHGGVNASFLSAEEIMG